MFSYRRWRHPTFEDVLRFEGSRTLDPVKLSISVPLLDINIIAYKCTPHWTNDV